MKKAKINIEDTGKIDEKENGNEEIKENEIKVEENPETSNADEEIKDDTPEKTRENEESGVPNEKEEPESKITKKYRVLIGMIGKTRKGGEIELSDEEAKPLLKEEYIEEV